MNDRQRENFDLDQLLHPAQAFGHPSEIVNDPDLTRLLGLGCLCRKSRTRAAKKSWRSHSAVR